MAAQLIDGKEQAANLLESVRLKVTEYTKTNQHIPKLVVILVGEDPASGVYVHKKKGTATKYGFNSQVIELDASTSEKKLLRHIDELNKDYEVDGILVQLPLPTHINSKKVLTAIHPLKDVDGFHPINTGLLYQGNPQLVPCTPLGCIHLLKSVHPETSGLNTLVIGRSNIVGRPLAALLLNNNCTVTVAHSHTENLKALSRQAQVVFAAAGQPHLVKASWITPGATVIDVGIHRVNANDTKSGFRLIGDVDDELKTVAGHLTPVPGGVGPMTIACLLSNTLRAADLRRAAS